MWWDTKDGTRLTSATIYKKEDDEDDGERSRKLEGRGEQVKKNKKIRQVSRVFLADPLPMLCLANLTIHHSLSNSLYHTHTAVFVLDSVYIVDTYHHEVASTTTCIKKARKVMATTPCRVSMALTQPEEDGLFMKSILKEQLWKEQINLVVEG